ncbi:molybdopterin molybdenumtransferase MoeA [Altererythrobacter luteolus]|uniref:Molybdopterin molybdenumtransferase n=1 Tax=Pontixanthobacter luteolus TaxID=295089 RepID=A0A6I4V002_9SPHN|nr:molybdopterin molybdotransferase MoeA [Pontixanthobacter luteolus]MXP46561.1 molybdopterin molybdenumtransferase MoeA [Pontixanthobacter luteolus]
MSDLLPLHVAQRRLLDLIHPTAAETVPLAQAHRNYLAAPLVANRTQPAVRLSAMDGFAVCGDGPWTVIGESRCGSPFQGPIAAGQAARISTGAHTPSGTDAIVLVEDAKLDAETLSTARAVDTGCFRDAGSDFRSGEKLLDAGSRFDAPHMALAAMAGVAHVTVRKPPLVAIIECGDELTAEIGDCAPHLIPATNGLMLEMLATGEHCRITRGEPVADKLSALADALEAASEHDLVVFSGGASVGDHDLVRPALDAVGGKIDFWRIAMKPGKPLMVASRGTQIILGLPGNPASSFVTGFLFMLPAIRKMLGADACIPKPLMVPCAMPLSATVGRRTFTRGVMQDGMAHPLSNQDSGALAALANSDILIERPEHSPALKAGTDVPVYFIKNGGIA